MRVHVLHHAACFDGAASAAVFTAFYRACVREDAEFVYIPKAHQPGDPFTDADFDADDSAIVDFRYSTHPRLGWYFDHHVSAFQLDGQREHFDADDSGRRFHDPNAPSCTGYIATIGRERFGWQPTALTELLHWAELIDTASFPTPAMPVELDEPALQLMTFVEQNRDVSRVGRFITDLLETPLAQLARAPYVRDVVEPALQTHRQDIELMRGRLRVEDGVATYDLSDQPPRSYNKFIAYALQPQIRYLVGVSRGPDGCHKLSVGYNPWLPADERDHDIAALCERLGGGGHPYVGGASFPADAAALALAALADTAAALRRG
ncbi:MAG: hypothetical protein ACE37F_11960 [Nannocystaceae bacterium]|nr:hypothetical protein [bacterium]